MERIVIAGLNIQYDCPILNFTCSHSLTVRDPICDQPRLSAVRPSRIVRADSRPHSISCRTGDPRSRARPPCNHPPVINAGIQFLDDYRQKDGAPVVATDSGSKDRRGWRGCRDGEGERSGDREGKKEKNQEREREETDAASRRCERRRRDPQAR